MRSWKKTFLCVAILSLLAVGLVCWQQAAFAALAFSNQNQISPKQTSPYRVGYVDVTFDGSGPTWEIDADDINLTGIKLLVPEMVKAGYVLTWNNLHAAVTAYEVYSTGLRVMSDPAAINGQTVRVFYLGY
jgi:hypothetical protein